MRVEAEVEVVAPQRAVFSLFSEFGRSAERVEGVVQSEMLTAEPVRTGTRFREVRRQGDCEMTFDFEVTAHTPPTSFEIQNHYAGFCWHSRYDFSQKGSRTVVALAMTARPVAIKGWLMLPLIWLQRSNMQQMMQKDLNDLERAAEAQEEQ